MQAVTDLHFLEIAQMSIERAQRVVGWRIPRHVHVCIKPLRPGQRQDVFGQHGGAFRIEVRGQRILVDQRFQPCQVVMQLGTGHWRRQVIDDDGAGAALGLDAFAGIVDDKGIEMRQRPQHRIGQAIGR